MILRRAAAPQELICEENLIHVFSSKFQTDAREQRVIMPEEKALLVRVRILLADLRVLGTLPELNCDKHWIRSGRFTSFSRARGTEGCVVLKQQAFNLTNILEQDEETLFPSLAP